MEDAAVVCFKAETLWEMLLLLFYFERFMMWMEAAAVVCLKKE